MLKTIKVKRVTEEIVAQIRDHIARGDLKAGDRLPSERDMAQQLGVGRPAVREALQVLEHTGFVQIQQGSGTYIRDIGKQALTDPLQVLVEGSDKRYGQVYEFRTAIEVWAAGLAARRAHGDDLARLKGIIERMKACREGHANMDELDTEFHLAIARACRNRIYYHVARTILHLLSQVTRISHQRLFSSEEDQVGLLSDHEAIFKAIEARDAREASHQMQCHLSRVAMKIAGRQENPSITAR